MNSEEDGSRKGDGMAQGTLGAGAADERVAQRATELPLDEARQVAAAQANVAAFAPLYRAYVGAVYRYLARQVASREDAEDLTAAVFTKALASLGRYQDRGTFAAWLFGIARHALADYHRHRRPRMDAAEIAEEALADDEPDAAVLGAERRRQLDRLVRQLPADQREALALRFFAGLTSAEAGVVLGRSEGAVRMLVHRAVAALRNQLDEEDPL